MRPTSASFRIVGTKGDLRADPAYEYAEALEYTSTIDGKKTRKAMAEARPVRSRSCSTSPTAS